LLITLTISLQFLTCIIAHCITSAVRYCKLNNRRGPKRVADKIMQYSQQHWTSQSWMH